MLLIKKNKVFMLVLLLSIIISFPFALMAQVTFERTYGGTDSYVGNSVQQTLDNFSITGEYGADLIKLDNKGITTKSGLLTGNVSLDGGNGNIIKAEVTAGIVTVNPDENGDYLMSISGGTYDVTASLDGYEPDTVFNVVVLEGHSTTNIDLLLTYISPPLPQVTFERTYGGTDSYVGNSVQQTSDGGYIVAGSIEFTDTEEDDVYLLKTDVNGDTLWTHTYGGEGDQEGKSVQQTLDGGYIIAGWTGDSFSSSVYLIKTNSSGDTLWTQTYGGGMMLLYKGFSVKQTLDEGFIISGSIYYYSNYTSDLCLIKTDASGEMLWTQVYGNDDDSETGNSVQQTLDGGYIIAGTIESAAGEEDVYLLKTNANGDTLWTQTYGGSGDQEGKSVQQTSDGGYIIAGTNDGGFSSSVYLIKTNSSGDVLWTQDYGEDMMFLYSGSSVKQTLDGGFIIAGSIYYCSNYSSDVYLMKTDTDGDTLWTRTYDIDGSEEYGNDVQLTMDGGFVVTGYAVDQATSRDNVYLLKTDENGMVPDPGWITGNISLNGGSGNVEDVEVTAGGLTVNPDVNGDYNIEIAPGTYNVTASLDGYEPDIVFDVVVIEGLITTDIDLLLTYISPPPPPTLNFERTYGGPDSYDGNSVQQTLDGGYLVAGSIEFTETGDKDVYLLKTDEYGDTLWTQTYGGSGDQEGKSVQQTSDGGYIIAGYTGDDFSSSFYLIRTDSSGDTLWTQTYGEGAMLFYKGSSVKQTLDGGFIIGGTLYDCSNNTSDLCTSDLCLIKTDASGEMLWTQVYGNDIDSERCNSVEQTIDGGYAIAGTKIYENQKCDVYLVKTNAIGDTLWTRTYDNSFGDFGYSMEQTSDGGYIIVGRTNSPSFGYSLYLVKTDKDGYMIWSKIYGSLILWEYHIGNSVHQTLEGGYIVAGYTGINQPDVYLVKTDDSGDTLWTRTYGTAEPGIEYANEMQLTVDNGFIITGIAIDQATSLDKVYLLKTDENGMTQEPGWITGNISLDGGSGNVEDVEVTAGSITVNPDVNGDYSIEIAPGTYDVIASLDGYVTDTVANVVVEEGVITSGINLTLVTTVGTEGLIATIGLTGNYPNPFNSETIIKFKTADSDKNTNITIYSFNGQKIKTLVDKKLGAGTHQIVWDGTDYSGNAVSSGIYFYKMECGNKYIGLKKMILMK